MAIVHILLLFLMTRPHDGLFFYFFGGWLLFYFFYIASFLINVDAFITWFGANTGVFMRVITNHHFWYLLNYYAYMMRKSLVGIWTPKPPNDEQHYCTIAVVIRTHNTTRNKTKCTLYKQ